MISYDIVWYPIYGCANRACWRGLSGGVCACVRDSAKSEDSSQGWRAVIVTCSELALSTTLEVPSVSELRPGLSLARRGSNNVHQRVCNLPVETRLTFSNNILTSLALALDPAYFLSLK